MQEILTDLYTRTVNDNKEDLKAVMRVIDTLVVVLYRKGYLTEEEVKAILELKYDDEK